MRFPTIFKYTLFTTELALTLFMALFIVVPAWFNNHYVVKTKPGCTKILLAWCRGVGEQETIQRLKIVTKKLGITMRVVSNKPPFYIRWFVADPVGTAKNAMQPDFILAIQDWVRYSPGVPNYMTLTLGTSKYIEHDANSNLQFINQGHYSFDALLPSFQDIDKLKTTYESRGKAYRGFAWYPTAQITTFRLPQPKKLFYSGGFLWDETRKAQKYKDLFKKLDNAGYFVVCGPKKKWRHTPNSAVGFIPSDGISLLTAHNNAGISLLLHSQQHLDGGAPTGRIFEAAAAKTVIISDKHSFVQKYFGDNVLYIDITQDADSIFQQIDQHMKWIITHPEEARKMAENCYYIFAQRFSMEEQVQKLIDMHNKWSKM